MSREERHERQGRLFVEEALRWEAVPAETQVKVEELLVQLLQDVVELEASGEVEGATDV